MEQHGSSQGLLADARTQNIFPLNHPLSAGVWELLSLHTTASVLAIAMDSSTGCVIYFASSLADSTQS